MACLLIYNYYFDRHLICETGKFQFYLYCRWCYHADLLSHCLYTSYVPHDPQIGSLQSIYRFCQFNRNFTNQKKSVAISILMIAMVIEYTQRHIMYFIAGSLSILKTAWIIQLLFQFYITVPQDKSLFLPIHQNKKTTRVFSFVLNYFQKICFSYTDDKPLIEILICTSAPAKR